MHDTMIGSHYDIDRESDIGMEPTEPQSAAGDAKALPDHATDDQLLKLYNSQRDHSAFEELVQRHGPLVWRVCRGVLGQTQDAEDAFQATFVVLIRKAGSV